MATIKDYVNPLDAEINEAGANAQARRDIPQSVRTRFDGKSIEDVMEAYAHVEQEKSRLGQTVGQLRTQQDQLMQMQLQNPQPSRQDTTESIKPLTVDELYDNPDAAISRVVEAKTSQRVEALEQQLATERRHRALEDLTARFPEWQVDTQSPEFKDWVGASGYRSRMAAEADQYNMDAANDLLELWYERNASTQETQQEVIRGQQLEAASMEMSGPVGLVSEPTFSRHELTMRRMAAGRGDFEAQDWLAANSDAIVLAYEEDRITD